MAAEHRTPGGLTTAQVQERHDQGQSNHVDSSTSRPLKDILRANLFTVFNGILFTAALAVILVGDWRDAVFGFVLVLNLGIGIVGEVRSKRALDALAVLHAPTSQVVRDGQLKSVNNEDLVIDDVVQLSLGDQVPADGSVLTSNGLEVDESPLTGESNPVPKVGEDPILSGTSVVTGGGTFRVEKIGEDAWAQKITAEAKKYSKAYSEIQGAIDRILKWITFVLPVIIILLMWSQLRVDEGDWKAAVILTVAGIVGMIPQGLVLLTSMNFGMTAASLARKGVLVQELPAVEILARVDVLCLDKTGTLTTGEIRGRELVHPPEGGGEDGQATKVLSTMVREGGNPTAEAVQNLVRGQNPFPDNTFSEVPFNSIRKWSALSFASREEGGTSAPSICKTWVFGAPEVLLDLEDPTYSWVEEAVGEASALGRRTVCLACSEEAIGGGTGDEQTLPDQLRPQLVAVLEEDVRSDAERTLKYFAQQGVGVKVISGDSHRTVGAIAADLGLVPSSGNELAVIDARTLPEIDTEEFVVAAREGDVFGRVTPDQKKALVVALQDSGHTVAMTGDGVNDALALKTADLGIAMGNGAPATKAVSRLVLVNSHFSVLPGVVGQGRRIIANMERVSSLFLTKTVYAVLLALVVALFSLSYPLLPRHLTYISAFTIGVPAFFLSLGPNDQKYRPGFLRRTLLIAVPSGVILGTAALVTYLRAGEGSLPGHTAATLTLISGAMALLVLLARPWRPWKIALIAAMVLGATAGVIIGPVRDFFALEIPSVALGQSIALAGSIAAALVVAAYGLTLRWRRASEVAPAHGKSGKRPVR